MSLMDREYMRQDSNRTSPARRNKSHGCGLVGVTRSEWISLGIGAAVITALLVLVLI